MTTNDSTGSTKTAPLMLSVSGCRGIVGASLTPDVVSAYAGVFAAWVLEHAPNDAGRCVVVGRDGRAGGEPLAQVVVGALRSAGLRVVDLGVATTPTVGVMVLEHGAVGGLVLTASHNPAAWNGLKPITAHGRAPLPEEAVDLLARCRAGMPRTWAPASEVGVLDADAAACHVHVARVLAVTERLGLLKKIKKRGFKVALNSVNASGAVPGRMLLEGLGCELLHVHDDGSGVFPHTPEPTAENLAGFCEDLRQAGCDVGFAQDPDADRLAVVDEQGGYVGEEYTLVFAAEAYLTAAAGAGNALPTPMAANLSTSRMIDDVAARFGTHVVRTPVGEAHVVAGMLRQACELGGEGNGGVILPEIVGIRDSLVAMAMVLGRMAQANEPVSAIAAQGTAYEIVKRKTPIREGLAEAVTAALADHFQDARQDTQDGLRIDLDDEKAWLHVRASNTEPVLRLIAEAPTRSAAETLLEKAQSVIAAL